MALDVGDRTIGIAVSDDLGWTAQPYCTIRRTQLARDLEEIGRIADEKRVSTLVVGLPLPMSGVPGARARRVKNFAAKLQKKVEIPVVFWDERFSTVAAQRVLIQADLSRAKRKKQVDKIAAAIILQGYLDSEKR